MVYHFNALSLLGAGSYAWVQQYSFNIPEGDLKKAIVEFRDSSQLSPPIESKLKDEQIGNWYFMYFYYSDENKIISTMIGSYDNITTEFNFSGIADYDKETNKVKNFKCVNRDFDLADNIKILKKFKNTIFKPLKHNVKLLNENGNN